MQNQPYPLYPVLPAIAQLKKELLEVQDALSACGIAPIPFTNTAWYTDAIHSTYSCTLNVARQYAHAINCN